MVKKPVCRAVVYLLSVMRKFTEQNLNSDTVPMIQ